MMNTIKINIVLFIIVTLCSFVYSDPNNAGVITLRDGVQGKILIVDTSGCTVVFVNSQGAKVAITKNRIKTLEWNSNVVDFSAFECVGGNTKPLGTLAPAPKDALAKRLMNLPVKRQQKLLDSIVYFYSSPLNDITLQSPVDVVAGSLQDLFDKLNRKEISAAEANKKMSDSVSQNEYLAVCFSIREKDEDGAKIVSGTGTVLNGHMGSIGTSVPIKKIIITVRIILVSLKSKCIIFDEEVNNTEEEEKAGGFLEEPNPKIAYVNARMESIRGAFIEIRYLMAEQGLIEKPGDFEILQRAFKKMANQ
jgi:hypothetical protein